MKNKRVVFFVCMLVMITAFSTVATTSKQEKHSFDQSSGHRVGLFTVTDSSSQTATDTTVATIIVPQPVLEIGTITGGFGIKAQIKNIGTANATNVSVNITLYGAWMILPLLERYHVILHNVDDGLGENVTVIVFGLGKTTIKVDATCVEGSSATKTATGTVFLFFMLGVK